ncbi:hypothetical protein ANMWB30_24840 [Arthrobacter sp. MWB30]|nr:hypothetical protein ANMWB30_24840 [Arthrobacter sp. MWB30]
MAALDPTPQPPKSNLDGLDEIHGRVCDDCRLVWIGGFDINELDLDPRSPTLSDNARVFVESTLHMSCVDEEDAGHGYFDSLICDTTSIGGHEAVAYMKP